MNAGPFNRLKSLRVTWTTHTCSEADNYNPLVIIMTPSRFGVGGGDKLTEESEASMSVLLVKLPNVYTSSVGIIQCGVFNVIFLV